jgi:hypothetical protein
MFLKQALLLFVGNSKCIDTDTDKWASLFNNFVWGIVLWNPSWLGSCWTSLGKSFVLEALGLHPRISFPTTVVQFLFMRLNASWKGIGCSLASHYWYLWLSLRCCLLIHDISSYVYTVLSYHDVHVLCMPMYPFYQGIPFYVSLKPNNNTIF